MNNNIFSCVPNRRVVVVGETKTKGSLVLGMLLACLAVSCYKQVPRCLAFGGLAG